MAQSTLLRLSGVGVPPYSARGLTQTLNPVALSEQSRRTINGALADVADPLFRKYASTVSGTDVDPPALGGSWPGQLVTVDCIAELVIPGEVEVPTEEATTEEVVPQFQRPHVPGSVRVADGFTFFRPRLVMRITDFSQSVDEWAKAVQWSMSLEEV